MIDTVAAQSDYLPRTKLLLLLLHSAQLTIATVVLGLDSYGLRYVQYNALIYSLTVAICTLLVCPYLLASQLSPVKLRNIYISIGLHLWMLVFWAVNTGLSADLAKVWSQPGCTYTPWDGYACSSYNKRDLKAVHKRDTSYLPYFGALVAGATLSGLEILMWVCTTVLLCNAIKRHSKSTDDAPSSTHSRATDGNIEEQQTAPNIWDGAAASAAREGPQPLLPPASPEVETERTDTYPFSRPCEQTAASTQVPPPWTSHHARMNSDNSLQSAATGPAQYWVRTQMNRMEKPAHSRA